MTRARSKLVAVGAVFAGVSPSCSEPVERPPIVWEGEHVRFGTDEDFSSVCAGTLPYLDELVPHLAGIFDEPAPMVDLYWVPDGTGPYCGDPLWGCAFPERREAFSELVFFQHEIVHAVRSSAYPPLEEGIAELYGDDWKWIDDADPARIFEIYEQGDTQGDSAWYPTVGHFASYLRSIAGEDAFLALDAGSLPDDPFEQTQARFESALNAPFEELVAEYVETYPICDHTYYRDDSFECGRNVVHAPGPDDERLDFEVSLECDEPDVLGPRFGERWKTLTLEVPVKAYYGLFVAPPEFALLREGQVRVRRCDSSCFDEPQPVNTDPVLDYGWDTSWTTDGEYCLEPGRYTFRLSAWENESADFRFVVWPARLAESCS